MPWKTTEMINERTAFALRSLQPGVNFSQLCQEYGISRQVGYKWKKRFIEEGTPGMVERSRRPRSSPRELTEQVICRLNKCHQRHPAWGPKKIHAHYLGTYGEVPSLSSIKRIFERSGWVKKRRRRPAASGGRLHADRVAEEANDVWTVDFKGWWHVGDGGRCEPLTVRDEKTRYVLAIRGMSASTTEAVRSVFEELFHRYGLPKAIRSDNGPPFASRGNALGLSRLSAWWLALGIDLERGRPGKPQDNGAHERLHRDIKAELQDCAEDSMEEQQAAFEIWRTIFNRERPHEALGMKTPEMYYRKSPRTYTSEPVELEYRGMCSRRVNTAGMIKLENRPIRISAALAGWSVGLKALDADTYEVYFSRLRIGQIELSTRSFLGADGRPEELAESKKKESP